MMIRFALLALVLVATPALAGYHAPRVNKKDAGVCTPSTDPAVPPCGVKDQSPTYFPEKLAPTDADKSATTTPEPLPAPVSKKPKHKKPNPDAPKLTPSENDVWEKSGNAQTH